MTRSSLSIRLAILISITALAPAQAEDIYVRAGAEKGEGTRQRPYRGIYKALDRAKPGDVIHVAQGDYSGKLGVGYLHVRTRGLTLLGGYSADFERRSPLDHPVRVFRDPTAQADSFDNGLLRTEGDVRGLVIDGFVFDATGRNVYESDGDLDVAQSMTKPPITLDQADCHLRYSMILNTAGPAVRVSGPRSSIEHCLILNAIQSGIDVHGRRAIESVDSDTPIRIRHNAILFTWQWRGTGGSAITIGSRCQVRIENNLLGFHQGVAISNIRNFDGPVLHVLEGNVFFQNRGGLYEFFSRTHDQTLIIDQQADLEEADLAEAQGNRSFDPMLPHPAGWFEQFVAGATAGGRGKLAWEDILQLRARLGLPGDPEEGTSTYAPAYPFEHALDGELWRADHDELENVGPQLLTLLPIQHPGPSSPPLRYAETTLQQLLKGLSPGERSHLVTFEARLQKATEQMAAALDQTANVIGSLVTDRGGVAVHAARDSKAGRLLEEALERVESETSALRIRVSGIVRVSEAGAGWTMELHSVEQR